MCSKAHGFHLQKKSIEVKDFSSIEVKDRLMEWMIAWKRFHKQET